jgi:protein required for attachment to host cells
MSNKFINPIVEEKHRMQDKIAKKANYNVHTYTKIIKQKTRKIIKEYQLQVKYADVPVIAEPETNYKP